MEPNVKHTLNALNQAFLQQHPAAAQKALNKLPDKDLVELLQQQTQVKSALLWDRLDPDKALTVLLRLPESHLKQIMQRGDPVKLSRVLSKLSDEQYRRLLGLVDPIRQRELSQLAEYPENSAGALMNSGFIILLESLTVRETLHRIRKFKPRFTRQLYLIDGEGLLRSMVEIHQLALAEPGLTLEQLARNIPCYVQATATREEVVEQLDIHRITDLPVVDLNGHLLGVIQYDTLMETVREISSTDMLTMVGASRDERVLSPIGFVISKRLPWLSINLLTAFLAASVVGLFESVIAQFTALAVLLPVVAGQSGNTGAQALAVTMRGLALREIGTSQWLKVARKEVTVGFVNGVSIALMTAMGVFIWSSSIGLALVIGSSMVIAMVAAGVSGVMIPVLLASLGQDPAQSSSIILTTVTDVVGFFAFLGIATLLSGIL